MSPERGTNNSRLNNRWQGITAIPLSPAFPRAQRSACSTRSLQARQTQQRRYRTQSGGPSMKTAIHLLFLPPWPKTRWTGRRSSSRLRDRPSAPGPPRCYTGRTVYRGVGKENCLLKRPLMQSQSGYECVQKPIASDEFLPSDERFDLIWVIFYNTYINIYRSTKPWEHSRCMTRSSTSSRIKPITRYTELTIIQGSTEIRISLL